MTCRFRTAVALASVFWLLLSSGARAVPRPDAIKWNAEPVTFVTSLYQAVLGREPENPQVVRDFAASVTASPKSRLDLFWAFVLSPEYQRSGWARQPKEFGVWWNTRQIDSPSGRRPCHCYYAAKDSHGGYMPSMQYTGLPHPADNLSFGVAMALVGLYATFDNETCPHRDCDGGGGQGSGDPAAGRPPGAGSVPAGWVKCRDRHCPGCAGSLDLLGQAPGRECQDCIDRNRRAIDDCARGGSQPADSCGGITGRWAHTSGMQIEFSAEGAEFVGRAVRLPATLLKYGHKVGEVGNRVKPVAACIFSGVALRYGSDGRATWVEQKYEVQDDQMIITNASERGVWRRIGVSKRP